MSPVRPILDSKIITVFYTTKCMATYSNRKWELTHIAFATFRY